MKRKSLKNGNKALKGIFGLVILAGAVLGLTAFILHFTNKGGCGEGFEDGTDPSPAKCKEASDQGLFDGQVACCGSGTCDLGSICGWARPSKNYNACLGPCANNMCESENCANYKCAKAGDCSRAPCWDGSDCGKGCDCSGGGTTPGICISSCPPGYYMCDGAVCCPRGQTCWQCYFNKSFSEKSRSTVEKG